MLRLQSLVNASDTLCTCSIGRRKTLKSIDNAYNLIFRTHITNNKRNNSLPSIPSSNLSLYSTNRFITQNSIRLKVLCVRNFHTQIIPHCKNDKNNSMHLSVLHSLMKDNAERKTNLEPRTHHSEKQLLHKKLSYHSEMLKEYPAPTSSLHNTYSIVKTQLKMERPMVMKYDETPKGWKCTCTVSWPENRVFTAEERLKKAATSEVSLQCLYWLKQNRKLKNGLPVVFDFKKIMQAINNPSIITIKEDLQLKLKNLLEKYEINIQPILLEADMTKFKEHEGNESDENYFGGAIFTKVKQRNIISMPKIQPHLRDKVLRERLKTRKPVGYELPINAYRKEILQLIEKNQVVLIKGDTGCGKTTQVPQFIMDSYAERGEGSKCNMLVTEPRRISAITLAQRVAEERGEKLGDTIGYKVKLQHKLPLTPGAILFCTPGILLKKLQGNPNFIGCSHVIIDEAHERTVDVDILLALLKRIIKKNKDIKVIIMSATLNADTFKRFFDCATIDIPGMIYPVKIHFIEEINKLIKLNTSLNNNYFQQIDCGEIANMIQWISDNKPEGAILCFLPGWMEIVQVDTLLKQINKKGTKQLVLPLHSKLSYHDQQKIFESPPIGVRKIILSTDIAETGITVRDVVYVVDCAKHKANKWDKEKETNTMQIYKISQSNLLQRKGRAGRVQSGESYHFVTKREFNDMPKYAEPEIQCLSLERVIIDCKLCVDDKVEEFLSEMPEPPDPHVVRRSVESLINLGALDTQENLTTLGKKISQLSLPPVLGKTLIYSTIFGCLDPILTVSTIFSINMEIFMNALTRKEEIRSLKRRFNLNSDHLALAWIYMQWEAYIYESQELAEKFSFECGITHYRMLTLKKEREQFLRQLADMTGMRNKSLDSNHIFNKNAQNDELIKGVLLAGLNNVLKHVHFVKVRDRIVRDNKEFMDESKCSTNIGSESVNHSWEEKSYTNSYFTYIKKTFAGERHKMIVRDSSIISPMTVLLFAQGHLFGYEHVSAELSKTKKNKLINTDIDNISYKNKIFIKFNDKDNVSMLCDENVADILFRLRDCIWDVVKYCINNQGLPFITQCRELPIVDQFKDEMITIINQLLEENVKSVKNNENLIDSNSGVVNEVNNNNNENIFTKYDGIDIESDNDTEEEEEEELIEEEISESESEMEDELDEKM